VETCGGHCEEGCQLTGLLDRAVAWRPSFVTSPAETGGDVCWPALRR
jgi:hypothetical protein